MTIDADRLSRLLDLQARAQEERDLLVSQRKQICSRADADGRDDLDAAEDREFSSLTQRITKIDAQIEARDDTIKSLADLQALTVPDTNVDAEAQQRAAAAELFSAFRSNDSVVEHAEETEVRRLSLAQAQAITALDT